MPTKEDRSKHVAQSSKLKDPIKIKNKIKYTSKQNELLATILDKSTKCVFISGVAGTGKTILAILAGLTALNKKDVSSIVYIRNAVESSDSKIGYLPGDIDSKIQPYLEPLIDKLNELLEKPDIDRLINEKRIETKAVSFLRGLSWNCKFIVFDEAQNANFKELTTLITRVGEFSKLVICGDPMQSDINGKSGFEKMKALFCDDESKKNGIRTFELTVDDIVRSEFVKFVVNKINSNPSIK